MAPGTWIDLAALVASIVLVIQASDRLLPGIAVVASGIEVLLATRTLQFHVPNRLPLGLLLGGTLAVVGAILYARVSSKASVSAATVVTLVGAAQLLRALHVL